MNDEVPDTVLRLQSLEAATHTAMPDEDTDQVVSRARAYYEFLTERRAIQRPNLSVLRGDDQMN